MSRIKSVSPEKAQGPVKEIVEEVRRRYGYVPGIATLLLPDPEIAVPARSLFAHLHVRPTSPLTPVQREMIATIVNGLIGGAP